MTHDTARLVELGRRRRKLVRELAENRNEILPEIIAAIRAGVPQARIVEMSGYTREQLRRVGLAVAKADDVPGA